MLRSALAALQSRRKEKKTSSSVKPLTAPSKFKLRLTKKKGGIGAGAAAAPQSNSSSSSPPSAARAAAASTFFPFAPMLLLLRSRLSALAGSVSAVLLLLAQVASLFLTFYVSVLRMALDFPLSLGLTLARTAAAAVAESRPVAAAAAAARKAARKVETSSALGQRLIKAAVPAKVMSLLPGPKTLPGCVFYECVLHHRRLRPARHEFEYRVRMAFLDLDAPPRWFSKSNKKNKTHHLSAAEARKAAGLLPSSKGPVWLLTMPPAAGYSQNPISVYYCYPEEKGKEGKKNDETLDSCRMPPASNPIAAVAEVTNTPWGSVARFSFDPSGDTVPKCLHVSPFTDMRSEWRLTAPAPGRRLALSVAALHADLGAFFSATLVGAADSSPRTRACLAERSGSLKTFLDYAYGPQRVALWIYGHAAVLFWRKKLSIFGPPALGAGARAVEESDVSSKGKKKRSSGISSLSSSSSSSLSCSSSTTGRWHEWVAAREWPWRVGACGI